MFRRLKHSAARHRIKLRIKSQSLRLPFPHLEFKMMASCTWYFQWKTVGLGSLLLLTFFIGGDVWETVQVPDFEPLNEEFMVV